MVMIQKMMRFTFAWQRKVREKQLNAAWKIYDSGLLYGELPQTPFQRASRRFTGKYMIRKCEKLFYGRHIRTGELGVHPCPAYAHRFNDAGSTQFRGPLPHGEYP